MSLINTYDVTFCGRPARVEASCDATSVKLFSIDMDRPDRKVETFIKTEVFEHGVGLAAKERSGHYAQDEGIAFHGRDISERDSLYAQVRKQWQAQQAARSGGDS